MLPTLDSPAQVESRLWRSSNVYFVSVIPREGLAHDSLRRFEALTEHELLRIATESTFFLLLRHLE